MIMVGFDAKGSSVCACQAEHDFQVIVYPSSSFVDAQGSSGPGFA